MMIEQSKEDNLVIEDVSIKLSVLRKLPINSTIIGAYWVSVGSNHSVRALKVRHHDPSCKLSVESYFNLNTGEYIEEA